MVNETNKAKELPEQDLDQVTGGTGKQPLLEHELTHIQQQKGNGYIGETEKNLNVSVKGKLTRGKGTMIVAQSGDGEI